MKSYFALVFGFLSLGISNPVLLGDSAYPFNTPIVILNGGSSTNPSFTVDGVPTAKSNPPGSTASPALTINIPSGTDRVRVELRGGDGLAITNGYISVSPGGHGHKMTTEFYVNDEVSSLSVGFIPGGGPGDRQDGGSPPSGNAGGAGAFMTYGSTLVYAVAGGGGGGGSGGAAGGDGGAVGSTGGNAMAPNSGGSVVNFSGGGFNATAVNGQGGNGTGRTNGGGHEGDGGATWTAAQWVPGHFDTLPPTTPGGPVQLVWIAGNFTTGGGGAGGRGGYSDSGSDQRLRGNGGGGGGGFGGGGGGGGGDFATSGGGGGSGVGGAYYSLLDGAAAEIPDVNPYINGAIVVTFIPGKGGVLPIPPTAKLIASAHYVLVNQPVTLTGTYWADTVDGDLLAGSNIQQPAGFVIAGDALSLPVASSAAKPTLSTTFVPLAQGTYTFVGQVRSLSYQGWRSSNTVTVVADVAFPPPTVTISANPVSGNAPLNTTITWGSTWCNTVTVSGPGMSSTLTSGSEPVTLGPGTHTFTINGTGPSGSASQSVTVSVSDPYCTLFTSVNPPGAGYVTGGGSFLQNTVATLTAIPDSYHTFTGWSGDATGTGNPVFLLMAGDRNVVANFTAKKAQLISFPNPGQREIGHAFHLGATASSGLPVAYTIIAGSASLAPPDIITPTAKGSITVRASQPGDATWAPAASVDVTFDAYSQPIVTLKESNSDTTMQNGKVHSTNNFIVTDPSP